MKVFIKMKDAIARRGLPNHRELVVRVRRSLVVLKKGLAQETVETKEMVAVYHRYTRGEATEAEMRQANQQFLDVIKGLGLSVVVILPFAPITLPAIVKLGSRVGIDVLPSAFKDGFDEVLDEVRTTTLETDDMPDSLPDYSSINSDSHKGM